MSLIALLVGTISVGNIWMAPVSSESPGRFRWCSTGPSGTMGLARRRPMEQLQLPPVSAATAPASTSPSNKALHIGATAPRDTKAILTSTGPADARVS
jgi:hypothetical protein